MLLAGRWCFVLYVISLCLTDWKRRLLVDCRPIEHLPPLIALTMEKMKDKRRALQLNNKDGYQCFCCAHSLHKLPISSLYAAKGPECMATAAWKNHLDDV